MSTEYFRVSAASVSSLRAGGTLRRACFPKDEREVREIFERHGDDVLFLGGLTNTLVLDGGVDETVVFSDKLKGIKKQGESLSVGAGERLTKVALVAAKHGLTGLEPLSGIPGTIAGAVRGNAGAFGREIADLLDGVEIVRFDTGKTEFLSKEEIAFSYRYSNLSNRECVTRVHLSLDRADSRVVLDKMEEYKKRRSASQPKSPSLGSVFLRHENASMGWYIDRCGLKGVARGAFSFSPRHAGFIVNNAPAGCAEARAEDYLYLVRLAEKRVYEEFGITPKREVKIIGDDRQEGDQR